MRIGRRAAHGELVQMMGAEHHRPRRPQPPHYLRVLGGGRWRPGPRAGVIDQAGYREHRLNSHRNTVQKAAMSASAIFASASADSARRSM